MIFMESPQEFMLRHGGTYVTVEDGSLGGLRVLLFADGARMSDQSDMYEPPPGIECLRVRRKYHLVLRDRAQHAFGVLKQSLMSYGNNGFSWDPSFGPCPDGGIAALQKLREVFDLHRQAIIALDAEIGKDPQTVMHEQRQAELRRSAEQERLRADAQRAAVSAINLNLEGVTE